MKKLVFVLAWAFCLGVGTSLNAQTYFFDNFDSYTVGAYLGQSSSNWTTWSGNPGGSDDVLIDTSDFYSDSNSIYFESAAGNGPHDVVLDFGKVHNSGRFKFSMMMKIPANKTAYFNFQGGASVASLWSMETYFYGGGTFDVDGAVYGNFPQGQWFEFELDCDLDNDVWEVFVNGTSQGSYTNADPISYLDLFPANTNSEWWVDDVSFCTNFGCNPELALTNLSLSQSSICTHQPGDITVNIKNNSTFSAQEFDLGVEIGGSVNTVNVNLNNLPGGSDTTMTISNAFISPVAGSNISFKAFNASGDIQSNNDTATSTANVLPSPGGSTINKGTPFDSPQMQTAGTQSDPDIIADGGTLTYELKPPTGFQNSNFGTAWSLGSTTFETVNGATVDPSYYTLTAPSGNANAVFSFTPDTSLTDSLLTFSFTIDDLGNGCDTFMTHFIRVVPRPMVDFSFTNVCDLADMPFTNNSTIRSGSMDYTWVFGDGDSAGISNPQHAYNGAGNYTVKLFATSDYGYVDSSIQTVTVYELPVADFKVTNACEGSALTFTDSSSLPAGNAVYNWTFGDGSTPSATQNPTHQYTNTGSYQVTLTVEVNGCTDQISKYATQAPRAVPSFTYDASCDDLRVEFTDGSTLGSGTFGSEWDFGDTSIGTGSNPGHTYTSFGTYDVKLKVITNFGCADSITNSVTILEAPTPDFNMSSLCSGLDVTLANATNDPGGGGNTYRWEISNGFSSTANNPIVNFNNAGSFTIKLVAHNSNGCSDSIYRHIKIDANPVADFEAEDVCEGEEVEFDNTTSNIPSGAAYMWDFGNGATSSAKDTSIVYGSAQTFTVNLYATTANGCSDTATKDITVNELPDATFQVASGSKGDGTMSFSGPTGSNYNYQWFMGDGSNYNTRDFDHTYNKDGNYTVKLIVTTDAGCQSETDQVVDVFRTGVPLISDQFQVYPNPSHGFVTIALENQQTEMLGVVVQDVQGKELVQQQLNGSSSYQLDLSHLNPGSYMMTLLINDQRVTYRLTIIH